MSLAVKPKEWKEVSGCRRRQVLVFWFTRPGSSAGVWWRERADEERNGKEKQKVRNEEKKIQKERKKETKKETKRKTKKKTKRETKRETKKETKGETKRGTHPPPSHLRMMCTEVGSLTKEKA